MSVVSTSGGPGPRESCESSHTRVLGDRSWSPTSGVTHQEADTPETRRGFHAGWVTGLHPLGCPVDLGVCLAGEDSTREWGRSLGSPRPRWRVRRTISPGSRHSLSSRDCGDCYVELLRNRPPPRTQSWQGVQRRRLGRTTGSRSTSGPGCSVDVSRTGVSRTYHPPRQEGHVPGLVTVTGETTRQDTRGTFRRPDHRTGQGGKGKGLRFFYWWKLIE